MTAQSSAPAVGMSMPSMFRQSFRTMPGNVSGRWRSQPQAIDKAIAIIRIQNRLWSFRAGRPSGRSEEVMAR